jgi:outer membrane protein OmpA-like peptidoglycan-associated protein
MRTVPALTLFVAITSLSSAWAQSDSVTVNPQGGGGSSQMLYDPGTGQQRVVPPLLQPWQNEPIRLRPPGHRRAHRAATAPEVPSETVASAPVAPVVRKPRRTATAEPRPAAPPAQQSAPQQQSAPVSGFSDFTDLISRTPTTPPPAPPPKTATVAPPPKKVTVAPPPKKAPAEIETPRVAAPVEKPIQKASIEPAKARTTQGTPRDSVVFAPNASDPSTSAVSSVRALAGTLNAALGDGNARVQLMAYAGLRGEKSSDTRRLSLKRALVIRQLLIDDGVPSERIDVFALGGADDGPLDRVDVFVKS